MNNNKNAKEANWALRDATSEWYHGPYISSNKGKSSTGNKIWLWNRLTARPQLQTGGQGNGNKLDDEQCWTQEIHVTQEEQF